MAGIFGPGADLAAQAIQQEQQAKAMQWAGLQPGQGLVALAAQAGQMFGGAMEKAAGYEDPRLAKAKLLQEAQAEVDGSGADLLSDPKSYYTATFKALQSRGLMDEAMQVRQLLLEEQAQSAINAKNLRDTSKGYDASGNMLINKDTGEYEVMEGYQGKSSAKDSMVTLAPPGTTVKGTGQEKTVMSGSPEAVELIKQGYVDTSKLPSPPRPRDTITIDMKGLGKYVEEMGKGQAATDLAISESARTAPMLIESSNNIRQALSNPDVIVGPGADVRLAFAKLMNISGADNADKIAQTQILMGRLAESTLNSIPTSNLGGGQGFTERDKEFLIAAKAGNINWDRQALEYMAYLNEKAAYNFINARNRMISNKDPEIREQLRAAGVDMDPQPLPKVGPVPTWNPKTPIKQKENKSIRKIKDGWTQEEIDVLTEEEYKKLIGE